MPRSVVAIVLLFLMGCAGRVSVDYREGTDFSDYRTFALAPLEDASGLDQERVQEVVRARLPEKGLREVAAREADLLVRHRFVELINRDGTNVFWGLGAGSGGGGIGLGVSTPVGRTERTGLKLVLQMVDQAQRRVIWEAQSRQSLDADAAAAQRREWIRKTVVDMLERFPPDEE